MLMIEEIKIFALSREIKIKYVGRISKWKIIVNCCRGNDTDYGTYIYS